jgi:hypothetical protein
MKDNEDKKNKGNKQEEAKEKKRREEKGRKKERNCRNLYAVTVFSLFRKLSLLEDKRMLAYLWLKAVWKD